MAAEHPNYKLGMTPRDPGKPILKFSAFRRPNVAINSPLSVDDTIDPHGDQVTFGLDRNNEFGTCVPTGKDNLHRLVSLLLTGQQVSMTWNQVKADYQTQNPDFDESGAGDSGMVIQDYLAMLAKRGDILGFALVDHGNAQEIQDALYLGLGLLVGVDLRVAQQTQTDAGGPWDYVPGSPGWGGHCVVEPAYKPHDVDVISWLLRLGTTDAFRQHQVAEVYFVVFPEQVAHPDFRVGFDLASYAMAFEQLTGRPFPAVVPLDPGPIPTPPAPPASDADSRLATVVHSWLQWPHWWNRRLAAELRVWLKTKGL